MLLGDQRCDHGATFSCHQLRRAAVFFRQNKYSQRVIAIRVAQCTKPGGTIMPAASSVYGKVNYGWLMRIVVLM